MTVDYRKTHALIVDGDRHIRTIIRGLLIDFGIPGENIRQGDDGTKALELLDIRRADFLITDWRMTPMDGITLTQRLRRPNTSPAPGIPVILCAESVDEQLLKDARQAGVNEIIVKPVNAGAINSRVTAVMERPRPLITLPNYIGPDRRRLSDSWNGVDRRSNDRDDWFI